MKTKSFSWLCIAVSISAVCAVSQYSGAAGPADKSDIRYSEKLMKNRDLQQLGEKLFFDKNLSTPPGQSCAACHAQEVGWTGPDEEVNKGGGVYPGAVHGRFGNRKPNSSAYANMSPQLHRAKIKGSMQFIGGNFWDGRATGEKLGNPAADQAQGPFLNPLEQSNADAKAVAAKACRADYAPLLKKVASRIWSISDICSDENASRAYDIIAIAIASFEGSDKVNMFSSKYDYYLKGRAGLTLEEKKGLALFEGKAKCAQCHTSRPGPRGEPPLFTDFTFDNTGIPRNPRNPFYKMPVEFNPDGEQWVDPGLAGFLKDQTGYAKYADANFGKHQVPTLRNVDKRPNPRFVKAYGHNGFFKSINEVVHYYNTRDVLPRPESVTSPNPGVNCRPAPEVSGNINKTDMGNIGLSREDEDAILAFLKTLSDGYNPSGSPK